MKHLSSFVRTAVACSAIATLALTGCAASAGEADTPTTLRLGTVTQLASFAPWEASWANQSPYLQAVYDTLLRAEPDGTITAGLATEWEWDESRTKLTLTLRDNVVFTDGEALTAQVAADYLTKFRDGTSENAAFIAGMTSAEAPEDNTLVISLAAPDPALPVYLSQNVGLIGSPAMLEADNAKTVPIGSGPYVLNADETVVGSTYAFEANADYWDLDSVHYDEIDLTFYGDPTALMNAVKGGQLDATNTTSAVQIPEAEAAGFNAEVYEQNWTGFFLADRSGTLNPAFGDVRVRQAFNHALDRAGLVEALGGGYGTATTQVFGVGTSAYDDTLNSAYPYDPAKARELLAEAGFPDGISISMPSNDFVPESEFAIYSEQLGAAGFDVEWEPTGDDLFGRMLSGSWPAFAMLLQTDPTPWQTVQFSLLPESTWNPFRVADPTVAKYAQTIRTGDQAEADVAARELNKYIVEQAWFAPIYRPASAFLTNDKTEAIVQSDNAVPYLWNIRPKQ